MGRPALVDEDDSTAASGKRPALGCNGRGECLAVRGRAPAALEGGGQVGDRDAGAPFGLVIPMRDGRDGASRAVGPGMGAEDGPMAPSAFERPGAFLVLPVVPAIMNERGPMGWTGNQGRLSGSAPRVVVLDYAA